MKTTQKILNDGINNELEGFNDFFKTIRPSLKLWDYFVNWEKVFKNTKEIEIYLNIWNYLIGKEDFKEEFLDLLEKHPEIVKAIPILIVRDGAHSNKFSIVRNIEKFNDTDLNFDFSKNPETTDERNQVFEFIEKTGLIRLFKKDGIKNLVDYVLGVEAGLDSNARKNRSGQSMEKIVESYLTKFSIDHGVEFLRQASQKDIQDKWGVIVPVDKATRYFDFAIFKEGKLIIMEVNFYGGGGSKLKATAGEYIELNALVKNSNTDFVWITDGDGWNTTKLPLKAAYEKIDYIWNLAWLGRDYLEDLI